MASRIEQIKKNRLEKFKTIQQKGINPYPYSYSGGISSSEALKKIGKKVKVRGRIITLRPHGGITFAHLKDQSGQIQLYFQKKQLDSYDLVKLLDMGDFVGAEGEVFKTNSGEITVNVENFQLLAKSLLPLPEKWHGLKDTEARYRKRYLDLIMNDEVKKVFETRSKIISEVRRYLESLGFMEVETPTLQPLYGGASARPFITHYNALDTDLFLKISDELYLKRLIIGGFEKVFEIDHDFRNEGLDKTHSPEFTMMECYWAYADYNDMMELTENLFSEVAKKVLGTTKIEYQGHKIDLKPPWKRMTMREAILKHLDWDMDKISDEDLKKKLKQSKVELKCGFNRGLAIAELFSQVEKELIDPVFITDHPKETTMLCKLHRESDHLIERFEPYIAGWEVGNAYSELNDPSKQKECFSQQVELSKAGDEEAHPMDEDFITALEHGMPPTGGLGIGIDRLVMLLTNQPNIRDVIFFPALKPKDE